MDYRVISIGALARHELWTGPQPERTAHATTTLIRSEDRLILVDPGLPPQVIGARLGERSGLEPAAITDVFLIVSASNERQVGALVDAVEEALLRQGAKPARREGHGENRWVLLDFLDLVVHVMHNEERALYTLERLWSDCPRSDLQLDTRMPDGVATLDSPA